MQLIKMKQISGSEKEKACFKIINKYDRLMQIKN